MSANSRTWFYTEPENRPYYIEERVNQSLWASRFGSIYLDCVRAESPFKMEGIWSEIHVTVEWVANNWLKLSASREDRTLVAGFAQVLQLQPTVSYMDENGVHQTEWWRSDGDRRVQEIQGQARFSQVKTYKK